MKRLQSNPMIVPACMLLALLMFVLAVPQEAVGQSSKSRNEQREFREQRRMNMMKGREGMDETVMLFFLNEMRKNLSLTNEQTLELLPMFEEIEKLRMDHHKERRGQLKELRELLEEPDTSDKEIQRLVDALEQGDKAFKDSESAIEKTIQSKLDVRQRAQLMFFKSHFKDRLRRRVNKVQRDRMGRGESPTQGEWSERRRQRLQDPMETPPPADE
jgi:hypothetical protein